MIQHVYPVNDIEEHSLKTKSVMGFYVALCKCGPIAASTEGLPAEDENGVPNYIFVHNSFDGREENECVEWVNEILNK